MPTLVDTSVWVNHFRHRSSSLAALLEEDRVVCHPLIVGELACGHLSHHREILSFLSALPLAPVIDDAEVYDFIESHRLYGQGLGRVDVHLLAAARLHETTFWTHDRALQRATEKLRCAYDAGEPPTQ
jgi:predicted nucleic acid-binding protein